MTEVDKRITLTDNDKLKSAEEQLNTLKGLSFKGIQNTIFKYIALYESI